MILLLWFELQGHRINLSPCLFLRWVAEKPLIRRGKKKQNDHLNVELWWLFPVRKWNKMTFYCCLESGWVINSMFFLFSDGWIIHPCWMTQAEAHVRQSVGLLLKGSVWILPSFCLHDIYLYLNNTCVYLLQIY